jgi:glycosyltransferase EpsF
LLIASPQIKAVHIHTLLSIAFYLLAAKWAHIAIRVTHFHNTADVVSPSFVRRAYQAVAKRTIQACATHQVACTVDAAEYLFGSAEGVTLLRNGFDLDHTLSDSEKDTGLLRELIRARPEEILLIQVARFMPVKNHRFSIDVLKSLRGSGFECRLALVGDGPLGSDILGYAEQQGVADRVVFLGVRADVPCLLGGADVMLLPSHSEGLGIVMVESQVAGLPAIASEGVPQEVDLGVGLINFLSIDDGPEVWSDCIRNKRYATKTADSDRLQRIRDQGYDVVNNVGILEGIYTE